MPLALLCLVGMTFVRTAPLAEPPRTYDAICRRMTTDYDSLESFYPIDWTETRLSRMEKFLDDWSERTKTAPDGANVADSIDYDLMVGFIQSHRDDIALQRSRNKVIEPLVPFQSRLVALAEATARTIPVDPEKAAIELQLAIDEVHAVSGSAQATAVVARRAADRVDSLRRMMAFWFGQHDGYQPTFAWWCRKPYDTLNGELTAYAKQLRQKFAGYVEGQDPPLIGDPIGREALLRQIKTERIGMSPEQMIERARSEYAWCETEIKRASREMGFGDDWKAALAKVKSERIEPGKLQDVASDQSREIIAYLQKNDLVTLEPMVVETWRWQMIGQEDQKTWPFAFYGGQKIGIGSPLPDMDIPTRQMSLRGNNEHFMRNVVPHELIPGHHLQSYMSQRYNSHRGAFETPFLVEGWALYWEMLLWDLKYPRGPEDRIGMLFWRMHRCARIVVSLGFHLGEMTPPQMIDYLVEKVGHERFGATSEVRRYVSGDYSPLYQCAYMIGGLQLRDLAKELVGPGKMSLKQFHDAVLHEGPIPVALIGRALRAKK